MPLLELLLGEGRSDDSQYGVGLGFASILLQLNIFTLFMYLFLSSVMEFAGSRFSYLANSNWQAVVQRAGWVAAPTKLFAIFALIQARGGVSDSLLHVELLVLTVAVYLSVLIVVLEPGYVDIEEAHSIDPVSGDIMEMKSKRFGLPWKVFTAIRSLVQLMLIFSAPPQGVNLIWASVVVRFAFFVNAIGSLGRALGLPSAGCLSEARADAERLLSPAGMVGTAPMIGSLALLDHIAWGPSSVLLAPLQPVLYCAVLGLAQIGLIFAVRMAALGGVADYWKFKGSDFDVHFEIEDDLGGVTNRVDTLRGFTVAGLYATMLLSICRATSGLVSIGVSFTGVCLNWANPLSAMAGILCGLHIFALALQYTQQTMGVKDTEAAAAAADENPEVSAPEEAAQNGGELEGASILSHLQQTLVFPSSCVVGLVVACMVVDQAHVSGESKPMDYALIPVRYGFLLTGIGVFMQVKQNCLYGLWHFGSSHLGFDCDCAGTIMWNDLSNGTARKVMSAFRIKTLILLQVGLLLGCLGMGGVMGVLVLAAILITVGPIVLLSLPSESRQVIGDVVSIFTTLLGLALQDWMNASRAKREAAAAAKAALKASALEAEDAQDLKHKEGNKKAAKTEDAEADDMKKKKKKAPSSGSKKKR